MLKRAWLEIHGPLMTKNERRFVLFSNTLFFIPFGIAIQNGIWLIVVLLGVSMVFSTLYHASQEKRFHAADIVFALVLIALNTTIIVRGTLSVFYSSVLAVAVVITLGLWILARLYPQHYAPYHGMWHIGSVVITTLSLLIYMHR